MRIVMLFIIIYSFLSSFLVQGAAKTIYIPENIEVEENAVQTTTIRNLSELGLYRVSPIAIIDDFIYITDMRAPRVVKLSSRGEFIARFGRKGQGPGESKSFWGISRFKENIAVTGKFKVIICSKDLKYLREKRLKKSFTDLILSTEHNIYFYNNPSYDNYYFSVYSQDFNFLKKFGIKNPNAKDKEITNQRYRYSNDRVSKTLYVPEENGIWVSFRDRYNLRYYKDEKVVVVIKTNKPFFSSREETFSGVNVKVYTDYSILIARNANQLYYFYIKGKQLFCDIFDLSENYHLFRRIKFPFLYKRMSHSNSNIFYGLRNDTGKENVFLDKIQINLTGSKSNESDDFKITR